MKKQVTQSTSSENRLIQMEDSRTAKKKGLFIIIILLLILVISLVIFLVYSLLNKDGESNGPSQKRDTIVTLENKDKILADLNNKVADGLFQVMMNVEWSFEDSSTPSTNAYVANAEVNTNTVYFDLTLDSTGETIYSSPYIPVGYALEDIALKSNLAAGTYACTVLYHLVDEENNYSEISRVAVAVTIHVLN